MREFDLEELAKFDGKDGRPAYIAVHGWVIDVSESKLWKDGIHMQRHHAGKNLTTDITAAPHGPETLAKYPQVGILKREVTAIEIPKALSWLLAKFPMLRRHPHPMTVHFPIVFGFSTTVFNVLYLITGVKAFELTALHCLGGWDSLQCCGHLDRLLHMVAQLHGQTGQGREHKETTGNHLPGDPGNRFCLAHQGPGYSRHVRNSWRDILPARSRTGAHGDRYGLVWGKAHIPHSKGIDNSHPQYLALVFLAGGLGVAKAWEINFKCQSPPVE